MRRWRWRMKKERREEGGSGGGEEDGGGKYEKAEKEKFRKKENVEE